MERMTLENLGNGAAAEKFQDELDRVLENVLDPNTDAKKVREVVLKVKVKAASSDRDKINLEVVCTSKLVAAEGYTLSAWTGKENGKPVAYQEDPKQPGLFQEPAKPAIVPMKKEA